MCYYTLIKCSRFGCSNTIRTTFTTCDKFPSPVPEKVGPVQAPKRSLSTLSRSLSRKVSQKVKNVFRPKKCPPQEITTWTKTSKDELCPKCEALVAAGKFVHQEEESDQLAEANRSLRQRFGKKRVTSMIDFQNRQVGGYDYDKFKTHQQGGKHHPLRYDEVKTLFWCRTCRQSVSNRPEIGVPKSEILGLCCDRLETAREFEEFLVKKCGPQDELSDDSPLNTPPNTPESSRRSSTDDSAPSILTEAPRGTEAQAPVSTTRPRAVSGNSDGLSRQPRTTRNAPPPFLGDQNRRPTFWLATEPELRQELERVEAEWRKVIDANRETPSASLEKEEERLWSMRVELRTQLNLPPMARELIVQEAPG